MIRIAIVEDDSRCSRQMCEYLNTFQKENGQKLMVTAYPHGRAFLEDFHSQFDLILMDIEMPHMDGMTTAERIRQSDLAVVIIFVTNMAQYAIRGYEVAALDYILKPISYFDFSQRLNRAIGRIRRSEKYYIVISVKGGTRRLDVDEICYVESQRHNLIFHTAHESYQTAGTMKDIEEKLTPRNFFRCNKGYLVSLAHVEAIIDGCAIVNGKQLLISRTRKTEFLDALADYIGGAPT